MVAYSFQPQFVPALQAGTKAQTIRAKGKRRHARPGDLVQIYTGMRTKHCRFLFQAPCIEATPILIAKNAVGAVDVFLGPEQRSLDIGEMTQLAIADGFPDLNGLIAFFEPNMPFEGVLIKWTPIPW